MKIKNIILSAAIVVLSAACQNQIENPVDKSEASDVKLIPVTFNAEAEETKTTLDGLSIVWEQGDQINVIDNSILCEDYSAFDATSAGSTTGFSGLIGEDADTFYALYPYDEATQSSCSVNDECAKFTTTLKDGQKARLNGLPANTNISFAKADGQQSFAFHNLCAVVKFSLTREDIATIEIAPNGENAHAFAGAIDVTVDANGAKIVRSSATSTKSLSIEPAEGDTFAVGTYFVCALPGTYAGGITVTFMNSDAEEAEISSDAALSLTAGKIRNLGTIDKNIDFGGDTPDPARFQKVTSAPDDWSGKYLIVYEGSKDKQSVAFNGSLEKLDVAYNGTDVTINDGVIEYTDAIASAAFTIQKDADKYIITSTSGFAIGKSASGNGLDTDANQRNTISMSDGAVVVSGTGGSKLRYNYATDQLRFRYYGSGQQAIALYKLVGNVPEVHVESVFFDESDVDMCVGDEIQLNATITPSNATNKSLNWESDNEEVATVDSNGIVTAVAAGEATITATSIDNDEAFASCDIMVSAIPEKTIAQFIESEGGKCYLTGIVSNIANTTYGNFDLTDESGATIYVYGCLTPAGEAKKFSTLNVNAGDKIKVLADEYEYYQNTTHEAKNVVFVEEIEIEKANCEVSIVDPDNGTIVVKVGDDPISSGDTVEEGSVITLTATPNTHCEFVAWSVVDAEGAPVAVANNSFTMPAKAVTISATFNQLESHTITVATGLANGSISASVNIAYKGEEVTLTATPSSDAYVLDVWSVVDDNGHNITVTDNAFIMPDCNVLVSASFKAKLTYGYEDMNQTMVTYVSKNGYCNTTASTTYGTWSGKTCYNTSGYIQINKNSNNYYFGATYTKNVVSITIETMNSTAKGRTFYICSSTNTSQPTSGDLGSAATSESNGTVKISLPANTKTFYIYSNGAAYMKNITIEYEN